MIVARVFGVQDTLQAFLELPQTIQNKGMRIGLNAAGGVIRDAAVANAPRESGLLRKSIKVKVKIPNASYNRQHHGRPAYAVVGPARRIVQAVLMTSKGARQKGAAGLAKAHNKGGRIQIRRPSRYAHLAGPGRKANFLHLAAASHGETAKAKMIQKIKDTVTTWALSRRSKVTQRLVAA